MSTKSYSLKFTPKASEDLEQIYRYIPENIFADAAAEHKLLEKMERNIMKLRYFPYSGSFALDEPLRNTGYGNIL